MGARALSLGGSYGALADDASSVYWNPAGLAFVDKPQVTGTHIILFEDTFYDFAAAGLPPRPWGALSLGYARQSSGNFEQRNTPFDVPMSFSIVQSAIMGGWGYAIPSNYTAGREMAVGAVLKHVSETINHVSASSWGGDLGFNVEPVSHARLAIYLQNMLRPSLTFVSEPIDYARAVHVSGTYDFKINDRLQLAPIVEVKKVQEDKMKSSGGLEIGYRKVGALRFGMNADGFSTGIGLRLGNFQWDYGTLLHNLGLTHQMTLSVRFGQTKAELEEFIRKGIQRFTKDEASRLARAYFQQGELYLKDKDYTSALKQIEAAALWDPGNRHIEERLFEVRKEVDQVLSRQILDRTVLLAEQQMARGNLVASRVYWTSVLETDPQNTKAKAGMDHIDRMLSLRERTELRQMQEERRKEDAERALTSCNEAVQKGQYRSAILQAEHALKTAAAGDALKSCIERARRERLRWAQDRYQQGLKLADLRDTEKAIEILESIVLEYPEYKEASDKLAQLKQLLQTPIPPEVRKELDRQYYSAVDAYLHGRYKEANEFVERILVKEPLNENARKLREKIEAAVKISQ